RQPFFVTFKGEAGLDAGGLSREFFRLASTTLFDTNNGLFKFVDSTYLISDDSASSLVEGAIDWYVFAGKLVGKALLEGHLLDAPLNRVLLKHIVAEPVGIDDLRLVDYDLWKHLRQLRDIDDLDALALTFSIDQVSFGAVSQRELVAGGADVAVTAGNLEDYFGLRMRERVLEVCRRGLSAFLKGVYAVVPPEALMLLSARELELAISGLPDIDVDEWMQHTNYRGEFAADATEQEADATEAAAVAPTAHAVIAMFWEEVRSWDSARRATLLQWCTGASRPPIQGFEFLQGRDGVARKFTLLAVPLASAVYPRAHTCFNRIDLPLFRDRAQL
ncbi:hypothetical protein M885DRAFT_425390, partial [Pelagophyceae sp. CCMP2097]